MDPFAVLDDGVLDGRIAGDVVPLPRETEKHLRTVLRRPDGAGVVLADGAGTTAPATLVADGARLAGEPVVTPTPRPTLHVLQGLAKGRKVDEVVRVLTELGVDAITPVAGQRSVKELAGPKGDKTLARWRAVATAAAEQSRRPHVPTIHEPGTVPDILARLDAGDGASHVVAAHVGAADGLAGALTDGLRDVGEVVLAVGPEGGWTDDEVAAFVGAGAAVAHLGASVLRTEHAAAALVAVVSFRLGRMD